MPAYTLQIPHRGIHCQCLFNSYHIKLLYKPCRAVTVYRSQPPYVSSSACSLFLDYISHGEMPGSVQWCCAGHTLCLDSMLRRWCLTPQQGHSMHSSQAHAQLCLQLILGVPVPRGYPHCLPLLIHLCCLQLGHFPELLSKFESLGQRLWQHEVHCHLHTAGQVAHLQQDTAAAYAPTARQRCSLSVYSQTAAQITVHMQQGRVVRDVPTARQ